MVASISATPTAAAVGGFVTSVSPANPAVGSGVLLVALVWASANATWAAPSGWTLEADSGVGTQVFSRITDGSEGSPFTFTRSVIINGSAGVILVPVTDFDPADPVDEVSFGIGTTIAPSLTLDSQTPEGPENLLLLQIVSKDAAVAGSFTPPSGVTERADTAASGIPYAVGDEVVDGVATGTRTWEWSGNTRSRGAMISINPEAGSTPPPTSGGSGFLALL